MICIAGLLARARKLRYYASISAKSNIFHKEEGEGGESEVHNKVETGHLGL